MGAIIEFIDINLFVVPTIYRNFEPAQSYTTQGPFSRIVVDLQLAVSAVPQQCRPTTQCIADRASEFAFTRYLGQRCLKPIVQPVQYRSGAGLPHLLAVIRRFAPDLLCYPL